MTNGEANKKAPFTPTQLVWLAVNLRRLAVSLAADPENPHKIADVDAQPAHAAADKLTNAVTNLMSSPDGKAIAEHLLGALNAMEVLEARVPLDDTQQRVFARQRASAAGRRSGTARKRIAAAGWRAYALKEAQQLRGQDPTISQDSLTSAILSKWQLPKTPAHETLRRFIASEEKAGRLEPKRKV